MIQRKRQSLLKLARKLMDDRVMLEPIRVGDSWIEQKRHEVGDKLMLVGQREAFLTGLPETDYVCDKPTIIHSLSTAGQGMWMSDIPAELVQMHNELARFARGRVLVGGLGLGILPRMVARKSAVSEVVIVENSKEIAELVWPQIEHHLEGKGRLMIDSVFDVKVKGLWDTVLLDTWQGTGEMVWIGDVVPLRRKFRAGGVRKIRCWQEGVMLGQVMPALFRVAALPENDPWKEKIKQPLMRHYYAFVKGLDNLHIKRDTSSDELQRFMFAQANAMNPAVSAMADLFVNHVGSKDWERIFGRYWDEVE